MERGIRKCLTFVIRPIASKFSEKYYSSPYNIEKTQVPLEKVFSMYLGGNKLLSWSIEKTIWDTSDVFGNIRYILPLTHRNSAKLLSSSYKAMRNTLFNFVVLNTLQKRKHFLCETRVSWVEKKKRIWKPHQSFFKNFQIPAPTI